jgi:hypothetical protein
MVVVVEGKLTVILRVNRLVSLLYYIILVECSVERKIFYIVGFDLDFMTWSVKS